MSKMGNYDVAHDDGPGFVGIKFCQECNNMLYPKEDKENKVLMYAVSRNLAERATFRCYGAIVDALVGYIYVFVYTCLPKSLQ